MFLRRMEDSAMKAFRPLNDRVLARRIEVQDNP
jgi:hypothetical protein